MQVFIRKYNELTLNELYDILSLRNEIFIVEQTCPYQDIDGRDKNAIHIFITSDKQLAGYLRILPGDTPSIGRVIVKEGFRKKGLARKLMTLGIDYIEKNCDKAEIKLQAQTYLLPFYESFGFTSVSEEYLEDNIPHRDMKRSR